MRKKPSANPKKNNQPSREQGAVWSINVSRVLLRFLNTVMIKCPRCGEEIPIKFK